MAKPRPTVEQLTRLADEFRRSPATGFSPLAEAYLALGRPRDAIEVANSALEVDSESVEARMMLGRAYATLHEWKESQAQLLRLVKTDKTHAEGFCLLGEVLMRRSDYDRALPVLQHAQNLDPANPGLLAMVKKARLKQVLPDPPPIPAPLPPAEGRDPKDDYDYDSEKPTALDKPMANTRLDPPLDSGRFSDTVSEPEGPVPTGAPAPSQAPAPSLPEPAGKVRPRVVSAQKPKDAASAGLRESAAVGEDYLNQLLTAGLLDVPNVRVPAADDDVPAGKRWGRSSNRLFTYLFVMLFVSVGAAVGFYVWSEGKKDKQIAQHIANARGHFATGKYQDLEKASSEAQAALQIRMSEAYSMVVLAQIQGIKAFLYRDIRPAQVLVAVKSSSRYVTEEEPKGLRELLIAKSSATLAGLSDEPDGAEGRLETVMKELRDAEKAEGKDPILTWLIGHGLLLQGKREQAYRAFKAADGWLVADIDAADYLLDQGRLDDAMKLYNSVLKQEPDHPLAFIGRALARAERSMEAEEAMDDINVGLGDNRGPRVEAYKRLALAYVFYFLERYEEFDKEVANAVGITEPRFLARVAFARLLQGRYGDAANTRSRIRWYGSDPTPHPLVVVIDAEILLSSGQAKEALAAVGEGTGLRARSLRGRAYWTLGTTKDLELAADEFAAILEIAPDDLLAQAWYQATQMLLRPRNSKKRKLAEDALDKLGRRAKTKIVRHIHGEALARQRRFDLAQQEFENALKDVNAEYPNPLAYQSHVGLARIQYNKQNFQDALASLQEAVELNGGYIPAHDLLGQLLAPADPELALVSLRITVDAGVASGAAELAYAKILLETSTNRIDRKAALNALLRARSKRADPEQLVAVASLVDEDFFGKVERGEIIVPRLKANEEKKAPEKKAPEKKAPEKKAPAKKPTP